MTTPVLLLARAFAFAAERHGGQTGKGEPPRPWLSHLAEVAHLVAEAGVGADADLVAAAVLHDTLEKTATRHEDLRDRFGQAIAGLVAEVTDDPCLSEDDKKRAQAAHAPSLSPGAKLIKLADKTSNLRALATEPAERWPPEARAAYVRWGRAVAAPCRGQSAALDQAFDEALAAFAAPLSATTSLSAGAGRCDGAPIESA